MTKGYVYILKSSIGSHYYIGSTIDVSRRLIEHNRGKTHSTKTHIPWKVVLKQACNDIHEARKLESKLKRLKRRDYIEKMVSDGYIKIG